MGDQWDLGLKLILVSIFIIENECLGGINMTVGCSDSVRWNDSC